MPKKRNFKRKREDSADVHNRSTEDDNMYFLNPEAVSQHLYCSICQDVFKEPQRAPCGHSYCKECIYTWLQQRKSCPEDRLPLQKKDMHFDFIVANIIGDQMVACPFRKTGCDYIGKLELLASHRKQCDFNPRNLPKFLAEDQLPSAAGSNSKDKMTEIIDLDCEDSDSDSENRLPSPDKPSLKMRLFRSGGNTRNTLCSMFERNTCD